MARSLWNGVARGCGAEERVLRATGRSGYERCLSARGRPPPSLARPRLSVRGLGSAATSPKTGRLTCGFSGD